MGWHIIALFFCGFFTLIAIWKWKKDEENKRKQIKQFMEDSRKIRESEERFLKRY